MSPTSINMKTALLVVLCMLHRVDGLSNDDVITLVHPHGWLFPSAIRQAAEDYMAKKKAEENEDVKIEIRDWATNAWGYHREEIERNATARQGADIITVGSTWASDFYDRGILTSLTDFMEGWRQNRGVSGDITRDFVRYLDFSYMFPGDRQAAGSLPEWFVLPMDVGTRVLFYRKDLFQEHAGITRGPITLTEAIQIGRDIMRAEHRKGNTNMSGFAVPAGGGVSEVMQVLQSFILGNGSAFIGPNEACTFETEQFRNTLATYTHLYTGINPNGQHMFLKASTVDLAHAFEQGKVAMFAGAQWVEGLITNRAVFDLKHLGVAPVPAGPAAPFVFQGGSGLAIPSWVPKQKRQKVWDFIEFFMDSKRHYLKDLTYGAGLIAAYESVTRQAKEAVGDGVHLGELLFYNSGIDVYMKDATARVVNGSSGTPSESQHPKNLLHPGKDWQLTTELPLDVEFEFPMKVSMNYYKLRTATAAYEKDPTAWRLYAFNDTSHTYTEIDHRDDALYTPLNRSELTPMLFLKDGAVSATRFLLRIEAVRGSMCQRTCALTDEQLPFAVPLHYPQQGFYKMGRIEGNGTIQRMVQRIINGTHSVDTATRLSCLELVEILKDPVIPLPDSNRDVALLVWVLAASFTCALTLVVAVFALHRRYYARRAEATITRLRSNNEMAEDLAKAVAMMELDDVEYLFSLDKPTRIQAAFIMIVTMLREYRAYLPAALLAQDCEKHDDGSSSEGSSTTSVSSKLSITPHRDRMREMGMRIRNSTLLLVSVCLQDPLHRMTYDVSIEWLGLVLAILHQRDGIVLSLRPDSVLASWNAHKVTPKHCMWGSQAALILQSKLGASILKDSWSIALSSGKVTVAHFGSNRLRVPFVLGNPLTQVEAVSKLCSTLHARILATDSVVEEAQRFLYVRPVEVIPVDPMNSGIPVITVWEVIGDGLPEDEDSTNNQQFKHAWVLFRNNNFREAVGQLTHLAKQSPDDYQVNRLLRLCIAMEADPKPFLHEADTYYRRFVGWVDIEHMTQATRLPAGVKVPTLNPLKMSLTSIPSDLETGQMVSGPGVIASTDADGLRTELEKARKKALGDRTCAQCQEELVLSEDAIVVGKGPPWTCVLCGVPRKGKAWKCSCGSCRCLECIPDDAAASIPPMASRQIPDGYGGCYERSDKILGRGAHGTVYLGMDLSGGLVAIKTVPWNKNKEVASLLREVELLSKLRHEYIVSYLSSCCHEGHIVIVMEYVSGGSLSLLLDQFGPSLNPDCVRRFLKDILHGLAFLHSEDIVHRDLKPCNVLLMADGQCKLSDFGTSTTSQLAGQSDPRLIGTPIYMSPEACKGKSAKTVDIWALGITVYQLATGDVPYGKTTCTSVHEFISSIASGQTVQDISGVSGNLHSLVKACLARDPAQRPTASKLLLHSYLL